MCWALNGLFQGFGAPPCAKILANWYPPTTRATWWGRWNASHNIGGFLIPLVAAGAATAFGWRWGLIVPGVIGCVMGCIVYTMVRDSPEQLGLPSATTVAGVKDIPAPKTDPRSDSSSGAKAKAGLTEVLKRPQMWILATSYFVVYAIRQGIVNWSHFYLLEERGVASAAEAAARVSGLELGGLVGNLTAGPLSDWLVKRAPPGAGVVGKRNLVVLMYLLMTALSIFVFWQSPSGGVFDSRAGHWILLFAVGHFIYGPQLLVAMSAAEIVPKKAIATSQGFVGFVSYMGAACSGLPLTKIVQTPGGWDKYFMVLIGMCVVAAAMMLPMLGQKNYTQAVAAGEEKNM
jgi:sugar phosphate permease